MAKPSVSFLIPELICAIGLGVAGLLSAQVDENMSWGLKTYSLTGVSTFFSLYKDLIKCSLFCVCMHVKMQQC